MSAWFNWFGRKRDGTQKEDSQEEDRQQHAPAADAPDPGSGSKPAYEIDEEARHEHDFRLSLLDMERKVSVIPDDLLKIMQTVMESICAFYDADWCGVLITDLDTQIWVPTLWFDAKDGWSDTTVFQEHEEFAYFPRWVEAQKTRASVIIPDCADPREIDSMEQEQYRRLGAHNIMGVPFGIYPPGFLIIRNAKRYPTRDDYARVTAYPLQCVYYIRELKNIVDQGSVEECGSGACIHVFGIPEVQTSRGTLTALDYKSAPQWKILVLLAISHRALPTSVILDTIWPRDAENGEQMTLGSLKQHISRLRSRVNIMHKKDIVISTPQGYTINWDIPTNCDYDRMDGFLNQAKTESSVEKRLEFLKKIQDIYKGAVYEQFSGEVWLRDAEIHSSQVYLEASDLLFKELAAQGDYHSIQTYASGVLKQFPDNPEAYYRLISALRRTGNSRDSARNLAAAKSALTAEEYAALIARLDEDFGSVTASVT